MTFPPKVIEPDVALYEGQFPTWPGICATENNVLVAVTKDGTGHNFSVKDHLFAVRSTDGGRTWSASITTCGHFGHGGGNLGIGALRSGTLVATMCLRTEEEWTTHVYCCRSPDGGLSWEGPIPITQGETWYNTYGKPVELSDGTLLAPIYGVELPPARGEWSVAALSGDEGSTWELVKVSGLGGNEWTVAEVAPGQVVGMIRAQGGEPFLRTISQDYGRTWSEPEPTNVDAARSHAEPGELFLWRGRLHFVYGPSRMRHMRIITCDDPDYLDWNLNEGVNVYAYQPGIGRDSAYPSLAFIDDHRAIVIDYWNDVLHLPRLGRLGEPIQALLARSGLADNAQQWHPQEGRHGIYGFFVDLEDIRVD